MQYWKYKASFFFSSRRWHTRYWRDWSSVVCSSDLGNVINAMGGSGVFTLNGNGDTLTTAGGTVTVSGAGNVLNVSGGTIAFAANATATITNGWNKIGRASCRESV